MGAHGHFSSHPGSLHWLVTGWRPNLELVQISGQTALAGMSSGPEALRTLRLARSLVILLAETCNALMQGLWLPSSSGAVLPLLGVKADWNWSPRMDIFRHCHCKAGHYVSGMVLRGRPGIGIWCDARRWRSPNVRGFLQRWSSCKLVPMGTTQGVPCVALEGNESLPVFGFVCALG